MRQYPVRVRCAEGLTKIRSCDCNILVLIHEKKNLDIARNFAKSCLLTKIGLFAYGAVLPVERPVAFTLKLLNKVDIVVQRKFQGSRILFPLFTVFIGMGGSKFAANTWNILLIIK